MTGARAFASGRRILWPATATAVSIAAYAHFPLVKTLFAPEAAAPGIGEPIRIMLGAASYFSSAWLAARGIGLAVERASAQRQRVPKLLLELISATLFLAATLATIMLVVGYSATGALTSTGVIVAVLGFALRNVIGDVFSGVALGLEAPYRIGDWIEIENFAKGRVVEVGWRTTRLHTLDQTYIIIPNSQIARERLTNYSAPRRRYRAQMRLVLDHAIPVATAKALMAEAASAADRVLKDPAPDVRAVSYDADGISYAVRYWVSAFTDEMDCRDAVLSAIDLALREHDMPAPRRRVLSQSADRAAEEEVSDRSANIARFPAADTAARAHP